MSNVEETQTLAGPDEIQKKEAERRYEECRHLIADPMYSNDRIRISKLLGRDLSDIEYTKYCKIYVGILTADEFDVFKQLLITKPTMPDDVDIIKDFADKNEPAILGLIEKCLDAIKLAGFKIII